MDLNQSLLEEKLKPNLDSSLLTGDEETQQMDEEQLQQLRWIF